MRTLLKTTICFLFWHSNLWAQGLLPDLKFASLGVNEGLSQNSVWDIVQTADGFLWIGTSDGLNRYDGQHFKVYRHADEDGCSISGQNFPRFFIDSKKQLWVSDDHGISIYNREQDCFKTVYKLKTIPMNFYSNAFIGEDNKGGLLLITADKNLLRLNITTCQIIEQKNISMPVGVEFFDLMNPPILLGSIALLSANAEFLLEVNVQTLEYKIIKHPKRLGKACLLRNNKELLFFNGDTICLYNFITGERTYLKENSGTIYPKGFSTNHVITYQGNYWYSSKNGIYVLDGKSLQLIRHIQSFSSIEEEDYCYTTSSYADRAGNLWICTNGDGLKLYSPFRNKFAHYKAKSKKKNLIKAVCKASDGNIYTAAFREQMVVFNSESGKATELPLFKLNEHTGSINCIHPIPGNRIAIALGNNLYTYHPKTKKLKLVLDERKTDLYKGGIPGLSSYARMLPIEHGQTFINLGYHILRLTFLPNNEIKYQSIFEYKQHPTNAIAFDPNGRLWVGTSNGIIALDTTKHQSYQKLKGVYVKCLLKAANGLMYAATQNGLYVFNSEQFIAHYTTKNGLPANFTYGLLEDNQKRIWISHNKGISYFSPITKVFKNYTVMDGLQSNEFNTGAYFKDEKGNLYFGGINGLNVIYPDRLISNNQSAPIAFTGIKIFEEPYTGNVETNSLLSLNLRHTQNTLSFDFSALEFSNAEQIQYAFILEGYDREWIYSGNKHYVRYTNLPFGSYVFKVKATNADGLWNTESRNLAINLATPFWRTYWFYFLVLLLAALFIALILFMVWRQQQLKRERKQELLEKLENERMRISRDLHDHVGAQLSYLISTMDWMLENPTALSQSETRQRLSVLSDTGRQAILTLRQTIWAINNKELSVEDFADRFKQFMLTMLEFNKNIQLEIQEQIDETIMLTPATALNLFRICQEAFNNCLKHADCTHIQISFTSNHLSNFGFKLVDNGKGFNVMETSDEVHYGLANMQARALDCHAKFTIESSPGNGTTVALTFMGSS